MYGQFQKSAQICSECLSRQAYRIRSAYPILVASSKRWQTTTYYPQDNNEQSRTDGEAQDTNHTGNQRVRSSFRYRHWRPHQATELGIETLGKPAEVLILPNRKPRSQHITNDPPDEKKASSSTFFNHDSAPVSWDDIKNNLLAVRDLVIFGNQTTIEVDEWTKLKKAVAKSFTREQLRKYLVENVGSTTAGEEDVEGVKKQSIAAQIMARVWMLKVAVKDNAEPQTEVVETSEISKSSTDRLKVNKVALDLALAGEGLLLKEISSQYDVQIDVYRDRSKVAITGTPESVREARLRLKQKLNRPPFQKSIDLSDNLKILARTSGFDGFLKSLMQKHSTRIIRRPNSFEVHSFVKASLDQVVQAFVQVIRVDCRNAGYSIIGSTNTSELTKMGFQPVKSTGWFVQRQSWYRYRALNPVQQSDNTSSGNSQTVLTNMERQLSKHRVPSTGDVQRVFVHSSGSLKDNIMAELGQALFNTEQAIPTTLKSLFASDIPLLPQILSSDEVGLRVMSRVRMIVLRFLPCKDSDALPDLEVHMSYDDINRGLKQPLKMEKVLLKFRSAIHDVLLPAEQVDVRLSKCVTLSLFGSKEGIPHPRYASLLKSLATYIEGLQTNGDDQLSSAYLLDVVPLLKEPPTIAGIVSTSDGESEGQASQLPSEISQLLSLIKKQKTGSYEYEYSPAPAQWLDQITYSQTSYPDINLEHTIMAPISDNMSICQQSLRVMPADHVTDESLAPKTVSEEISMVDKGEGTQRSDLESVLDAAVDLSRRLTSYFRTMNDAGRPHQQS